MLKKRNTLEENNNSNFSDLLKELQTFDDDEEILKSLDSITECFAEIIESIYDGKPELKYGEVFIETLSVKILLTTLSIIELSNGFFLKTSKLVSNHRLLDFSSINVLTRSIIESYLTLEYLFYNNLEDSHKEFRLLIWKVSGYKSRQNFFDFKNIGYLSEDVSEKLKNELEEIDNLLKEIEKSPFYKNLNKNDLWKLDKFGIPRLESWSIMLENSSLNTDSFSLPYKLYSNYAHSEFISLIQLNGEEILNKSSEKNKLHLKNALRIVAMINCTAIINLKNKFDCTSKSYNLLSKEIKKHIEFWNNISVI